jgi:hypothetical protein
MDSRGTPPEMSNFYCLPGRAGGTLNVLVGARNLRSPCSQSGDASKSVNLHYKFVIIIDVIGLLNSPAGITWRNRASRNGSSSLCYLSTSSIQTNNDNWFRSYREVGCMLTPLSWAAEGQIWRLGPRTGPRNQEISTTDTHRCTQMDRAEPSAGGTLRRANLDNNFESICVNLWFQYLFHPVRTANCDIKTAE